jgi:hypothetical protein
MSNLKVVGDGLKDVLRWSLGFDALPVFDIGLSQFNVAPAFATHLASYTGAQVYWGGYADIAVPGWGAPALANPFSTSLATGPVTFTNTDLITTFVVNSYYLKNTTTGLLFAAVLLASAVSLAPGQSYAITPTLEIQSIF